MTVQAEPGVSAVDVAFAMQGSSLPRDYAQGLSRSLGEHLPWLADDGAAGIHPLKLVHGLQAQALLSPRTRLLLRVPMRRWPELQTLSGAHLSVMGCSLTLGPPQIRPLLPHATLYAYKVAANSADELAFMSGMQHELALLEIALAPVCGKHQQFSVTGGLLNTFSLMLHGLQPEQSLRLQQRGLGPQRLLGCGIFVPHKSAAPV